MPVRATRRRAGAALSSLSSWSAPPVGCASVLRRCVPQGRCIRLCRSAPWVASAGGNPGTAPTCRVLPSRSEVARAVRSPSRPRRGRPGRRCRPRRSGAPPRRRHRSRSGRSASPSRRSVRSSRRSRGAVTKTAKVSSGRIAARAALTPSRITTWAGGTGVQAVAERAGRPVVPPVAPGPARAQRREHLGFESRPERELVVPAVEQVVGVHDRRCRARMPRPAGPRTRTCRCRSARRRPRGGWRRGGAGGPGWWPPAPRTSRSSPGER